MADQEPEAQVEAPEAPEPIAETPVVPDETTEAPQPEPSQPDYKAIADAEKKRADDAEKAAADKAFKLRQAKREDPVPTVPEGDEDVIADRPLTVADLDRVLDEREAGRAKKDQETQALALARKNTTSEDQAQAAFQTWRSRVQPSGNLEEDVLFAVRGIHASVIQGQSAEVQRARASEATVTSDTAQAVHQPPAGAEIKIAPNDAQGLKSAGFVWDGARRLYKKPLDKTGKLFRYHDPKSKQSWNA